MTNKKSTLMGRRKLAIIIMAVLVVLLTVAAVFVFDFINATAVEDPADGSVYYVREKDDVYALYDSDRKTVLPTDEQHGYYVTHAGTLIEVDAESGEYEIIAVVDTEGNEQVGINNRVIIFPHTEKKNISKLEVHNEHGSYTFLRYNIEKGKPDNSSDFIIEGSPQVSYDQELFSTLHVSAAYTITTRKIVHPIKDAQGEYSEYGLVPEVREREKLDANGEFVRDENGDYIIETYDYTPAYYVLTDTSDNVYKIIIGDKLVTGGGYYVQYVNEDGSKRDAVYVLDETFGETLLAPIEDFVTPQLTYPMTMNTYTNVENFFIVGKNPASMGEDDYFLDPVVSFSFVPLEERQGTINIHTPYFFHKDSKLGDYGVSADNINTALMSLYDPDFERVVKLAPALEDFYEYGLAEKTQDSEGKDVYEIAPEYVISFNYDIIDSTSGAVTGTVNNRIYISKKTDDGKYYAFTEIYDIDDKGKVSNDPAYDYGMIVEIKGHTLEFLNWDRYDWIDENYVALNIAYADSITLTDKNGYSATFDLDNSASDQSNKEQVNSSYLQVTASDSNGNSTTTFSHLTLEDTNKNIWTITASEIKCYSAAGKELKITSAYYSYNKLGSQVRVNRGEIVCSDGSRVTVNADTIEIRGKENRTIVRYHTELFRDYFQTLLYASISDSYHMSEEDEKALVENTDKLLLTMTIKDTEGGEKVYKFYKLTSLKAYITVNGKGGFYVLTDRVEKFVTDAQRFFALELIDATAKH